MGSYLSTPTTDAEEPTPTRPWLPIPDHPIYTPRKIRIVTVGAGVSGLSLAHKIQHGDPTLEQWIDHRIYEKNQDVAGTWLENRYPGLSCDVPAVGRSGNPL